MNAYNRMYRSPYIGSARSRSIVQTLFAQWTTWGHCFLAVVVLMQCGGIAWAEDGQRQSFSAEERARIDNNAMWGPREVQNLAQVESFGSVLQWLIARTPLPVAEEIEIAAKKHDEVVAKYNTSTPPASAAEVLAKLVETLPPRMRPKEYDYSLTVVDQNEARAFTLGAGRIYIAQDTLLAALAAEGPAAKHQLAFVLAHELGHLCLGHVRRLYQRQWLYEQMVKDADASAEDKEKAKRYLDNMHGVGVILEYAYTREDDFHADVFAVHLCRNAGFNVENGLDVLRRQAVAQDASLLNEVSPREGVPPVEPEIQKAVTGEAFTLAEPPKSSHRLRRLRLELDGLIYGDAYGLFEFDRETKEVKPAGDKSLAAGSRVVVCIHGMESSLQAYLPLMRSLAAQEAAQNVRILGFQYPADESLARSAKFLAREMQRVCAGEVHVDFVCHSAGGLVLRHYIEVDNGKFHQAYFHGTPHHGSDLASLRSLLEVGQFIGDLKLGYDAALTKAICDGHGQMSHDLLPDSLFLAYLNAPRENLSRDRYVIFRGRAYSRTQSFFLRAALEATSASLNRTLDRDDKDNTVSKFARAAIKTLALPNEIADGDLCVTCDSASLEGVKEIHDVTLKHTALPRDPELIDTLVPRLISDK